jgi:hypothetical protein
MKEKDYSEKFQTLFKFGSDGLMRTKEFTPDYKKFGFNEDDIDDLIKIALDEDLFFSNNNDEALMYAPCHSIMALAQLETIELFDALLARIEFFEDDDYYTNAALRYFEVVGYERFTKLIEFFLNSKNNIYNRMLILEAIEKISKNHKDTHEMVEKTLVTYLQRDDELDDGLNAIAIFHLIDISGDTHIELIREVFSTKPVDVYYDGDLEDVEIRVGLRKHRDTPKPKLFDFADIEDEEEFYFNSINNESFFPYIREEEKIGRNDPCPCGSGKKYKKCCLNNLS